MKQFSVPLLEQLATIVSGDLEDAVTRTTLDTWQETLALILTYAKEQEFVPLCQQLSNHMEKLGDRDAALLCAVCAIDVGSLLRLGLNRSSDSGVRSHLSVMEALLILCSMVTPQDLLFSQEVVPVGAKLAGLCMELKDQGMESVTRFLQSLRNAPSAQSLVQAIAVAAPDLLPGYVISKSVSQTVPAQSTLSQSAQTSQSVMSGSRPVQPVFTSPVQSAFPAPVQQSFTSSVPKPFMPSMVTPVQPTPIQSMTSGTSMDRPRPAPFIPSTPIIPPQSLQTPPPQASCESEAEPEVEYEYAIESMMSVRITPEEESVMNAISHTIDMLSQAPLTTV